MDIYEEVASDIEDLIEEVITHRQMGLNHTRVELAKNTLRNSLEKLIPQVDNPDKESKGVGL